jgi:hypothetical protein
MAEESGRVSTWIVRVVVFGGAVAGLALVVAAIVVTDEPIWWWLAGVPLAAFFGAAAAFWIVFRLRHRSPEERKRALDDLTARQEASNQPLERSRLAHKATKHKKAVLRSGTGATAVVRFLADGHRANEFKQLVYVELEVTAPGRRPYVVKTGEYLDAASTGSMAPGRTLRVKVDPQNPQRVAVDWESSLRLNG